MSTGRSVSHESSTQESNASTQNSPLSSPGCCRVEVPVKSGTIAVRSEANPSLGIERLPTLVSRSLEDIAIEVDFLGSGPSTAIQPESGVLSPATGNFVKHRGHRKIRPRGSSPRSEARLHEGFGHCTSLDILVLPAASCSRCFAGLGLSCR